MLLLLLFSPMWLLLFSPACPVFNFCSGTSPFVCLWCKKKWEHVFVGQSGVSRVLVE